MVQKAANQIDASSWTLYDKVMYGGLGYGSFCLPSDFFKVILAIIFPPLGELVNIVEDTVSDVFPYFTWDTLLMLFSYNAITHLVYSLILTSIFYIPGLVYTLTNIVNKERRVAYDYSTYIYKNPKITQPSDDLDSSGTDDVQMAGETVGSKVSGGINTGISGVQMAGETVGSKVGGGFNTGIRGAQNAGETVGSKVGGGFNTGIGRLSSIF